MEETKKYIEKKQYKTRRRVIEELINLHGNKCPACGKDMDVDNCVVDHIYPVSMGGTDDFDNLQILCESCNLTKGNRPFLGHQFEEYIKKLLKLSRKYTFISNRIKVGEKIIDADVVFEKEDKKEKTLFIAEVSILQSYTEDRIQRIINRLLGYKELLPTSKLVFITPSDLPHKYLKLFEQNGIQLWDKDFIFNEFEQEINKATPSVFKVFFASPTNKVKKTDKYQELINKLNTCPAGWSNWVDYQRLVEKILELLFCPPLSSPIAQSCDKTKKNRRDFVLPNYSKENYIWEFLRDRYYADYIVVDAKNSKKYISKNDVLQIANYLKKEGAGLFGIIIARTGTNNASEIALRDMWVYQHKMIVVLNDTDIEQMLLAKQSGEDPAGLVLKKIEDFRLLI